MGLDSVEIVMAAEEHFKVDISNEEAEEILTVSDFCKCIERAIEAQGKSKDFEEIFVEIRALISKNMAIPINKIKLESEIVKDLKIN